MEFGALEATIAGSDGSTFIDCRTSGNILQPDYVTYVGGFYNIDDVAPLAGPGSNPSVPEPSTWAMLLIGFGGLGFAGYRSSRMRLATTA
jgi:hypothetical protein